MASTLRPVALLLASAALAQIACSSADSGSGADDPDTLASALTGTAGPIVSALESKCLDDSGDGTANGNKIQLYSCNETSAQSWTYTNGTFVGPGGKCLDIKSDDQVAGTIVQLYACNGTNAQKWTISGKAIKSTGGLCLDVRDGDDGNGTQIQIYGCNGNPSQQWTVTGVTSAPDAGSPADAGKDAAKDSGSAPASCTFDGKTIASGSDVSPDPYTSATVPYGDTCTTETVKCTDGVLSPAGASPTCTVDSKPAGGPSVRQFNTHQTTGTGGNEGNSATQFKTPTEKGNTLWVVATIPNDGAQNNVSVEDTQGNTFTALDGEHDTGRGAQTVWHFYATNIKGDSTSTPDTVTVLWGGDNYKGVLITEVAGASAASLVGHSGNIQTEDAPSSTNGVTSNTIETPTSDTPALLLSLSMDTYGGTSDEGGDLNAGPIVGSGFTSEAVMWNFDPGQTCTGGLPCNLATFESQAITSTKEAAGLFTARAPGSSSDPGTYVTVAAVFH